MADPLSPIAGNQQQRRPHHNSNASIKSFATAETHPDDSSFARDPTAPSSPFLYEAERSTRSPTKPSSPYKSPSKSGRSSPTKMAAGAAANPNDSERRLPLTEETLRANEFSTETPRMAAVKANFAPPSSHRSYCPSESAFSTFSAIPNVDATMYSKYGMTPGKSPFRPGQQQYDAAPSSPTRAGRPHTPTTARPAQRSRDFDIASSPAGSPEDNSANDADGNTTSLMDFTEQLDVAARSNRSPVRTRNSPSKTSRDQQYQPRDAAGFKPASTSQVRELTNLLDFDIPPAPTPRSLPSITPRELESLKAGLMGQISALKATLQGKEAEISALKGANSDAENRVGEALEQVRSMRDERDALTHEKGEWSARDRETQRVLQDVRAQIQATEQERMQLEDALSDAERRADDAELRAQEAEGKAAGAQEIESGADGDSSGGGGAANKAVQVAVEKVARELHALYKAKHETKVGQLKKSYEARWSKKTDALRADIDRLEGELADARLDGDAQRHQAADAALRAGNVESMTAVQPQQLAELAARDAELAAVRDELARVRAEAGAGKQAEQRAEPQAGDRATALAAEVDMLRSQTRRLARDLAVSRDENSALVATVDEFLAMDVDSAAAAAVASVTPLPDSAPPSAHPSNAGSRPGSAMSARVQEAGAAGAGGAGPGLGKPSGLKGPGFGFGQSRIGLGPPPGAMKRSVSGGSRSGIMSSIERMGRGRGAGGE